MKRLAKLLVVLAAVALADARIASADNHPGPYRSNVYTGYRPWYGGVCGWGKCYGYYAYPAYPWVNPGYRASDWGYPPTSYYYGDPNAPPAGRVPYPRSFSYVW